MNARLSRFPAAWGLGAVMALAAVLRAVGLSARGLEYDDAFSILLASRPPEEIIAGTAADTMPPLYYFLLHVWLRLGQQIWMMRLLNVALSLAVVLVVYLVGRALFDPWSGVWAGFFAAVSPLQIFHAQGMRMYVLLALALLGYVWFFVRIWTRYRCHEGSSPARSRPGEWAALAVCGALAMYSHNLAAFTLAAPNVFLALRRDWRALARLLLAQGVIGLLALPWLAVLPGQFAKVQAAFWTPRPGLLEVIQMIVTFHTNLPVPEGALPLALSLSLFLLALVVVEMHFTGRGDPGVHLLAALALVPPALLFGASYLIRPVFLPRPLMLSSLAYYGLAGRAVARARRRGVGAVIAGAFALGAALVLPAQYGDQAFPRSPFAEAAAFLRAAAEAGDVILHDNKLSYFPTYVYAPELPQTFLPDPPGSHNDTLAPATRDALGIHPAWDLSAAVGEARRVWFVVFERAIWEFRVVEGKDHPILESLASQYELTIRHSIGDLHLYLFLKQPSVRSAP